MPSQRVSLRREIDQLTREQQLPVLLITFAFWIVCAAEWTQEFTGTLHDPRFWSLLSLIVTVYTGVQVFRLRTSSRVRTPGSGLDQRIDDILRGMESRGFTAFRDVPAADRKIHHVVVGPSGIYAIETKARSGSGRIERRNDDELIFGGRIKERRPLRQARASAGHVQSQLNHDLEDTYAVRPLVVIAGNWQVDRPKGHFTVDVTTADKLAEYFDEQPPQLTGKEIGVLSSYFGTHQLRSHSASDSVPPVARPAVV